MVSENVLTKHKETQWST